EAQMRVARWIAIPFVLLQFLLYKPPPATAIPFPRLPVAFGLAAIILGLNVASLQIRKINKVNTIHRVGDLELLADSLVAMGVVFLFSFDPSSSLWALLTIPVLEGAVRRQRRGALATWFFCAVFYTLRDYWAAHVLHAAPFRPDSITYRMGIILIVAAATGTLAHNLHKRVSEELRARRESDH